MIRDPLEIFLFGKYFLVLQAWVKSQDRTPRNEFRISILFNVHIGLLSGHYIKQRRQSLLFLWGYSCSILKTFTTDLYKLEDPTTSSPSVFGSLWFLLCSR